MMSAKPLRFLPPPSEVGLVWGGAPVDPALAELLGLLSKALFTSALYKRSSQALFTSALSFQALFPTTLSKAIGAIL